jgi:hypothetical protein
LLVLVPPLLSSFIFNFLFSYVLYFLLLLILFLLILSRFPFFLSWPAQLCIQDLKEVSTLFLSLSANWGSCLITGGTSKAKIWSNKFTSFCVGIRSKDTSRHCLSLLSPLWLLFCVMKRNKEARSEHNYLSLPALSHRPHLHTDIPALSATEFVATKRRIFFIDHTTATFTENGFIDYWIHLLTSNPPKFVTTVDSLYEYYAGYCPMCEVYLGAVIAPPV